MVIIPAQVVFDTCRVASIIDANTELGPSIEERMRTIMIEANFLSDCPNQKPEDDTSQMQANPYFMDAHVWGCGPFPPEPTASGFPTTSYTCQLPQARAKPERLASQLTPTGKNLFGTHPPVGKAQMLYDLCMAAYELSSEPLGKGGDPYVLTYSLDHSLGITWGARYARLYTEVYLFENCLNGRTGPPPNEMDPDFSKTRNWGCGPYI
jgi:hypothetical protein